MAQKKNIAILKVGKTTFRRVEVLACNRATALVRNVSGVVGNARFHNIIFPRGACSTIQTR